MQNYEYPLNPDWSTAEIVAVVDLLAAVEQAYEGGIECELFRTRYQAFKQIVTSIGEEKRIDRSFTQASGYSLYRVVQAMKQGQTTGKQHKLQLTR